MLKQPVYMIYVTVTLGYPWVTLGYPGFMSVSWNQKGHGMQETLCFLWRSACLVKVVAQKMAPARPQSSIRGGGRWLVMKLWCQEPTRVPMERMLRVCNALRTRRRVGQPPKLTWGQSRYPSHQATRRSTDNFSASAASESRDSEASSDTIFILAFSIIMLNTDLLAASECSHLRSCTQQHVTILPHLDICPRTPTQGTILEWRKRCVLRSLCACLSDVKRFAFLFVLFVFSIEHLNEVHYFRTDSIKVSAIQRQQPWHRWWKGASKMGVPGGLQIGIWKMAAVFVIYFYDIQ